jgi:hypothetical protein
MILDYKMDIKLFNYNYSNNSVGTHITTVSQLSTLMGNLGSVCSSPRREDDSRKSKVQKLKKQRFMERSLRIQKILNEEAKEIECPLKVNHLIVEKTNGF